MNRYLNDTASTSLPSHSRLVRSVRSVREEAGFSLQELLLVLFLVVILLGLGLPVISTTSARNHLTQSAQQIVTQMQFARMKAVSSNEIIQVRFSREQRTYQVESASGELLAGPFSLPAGVSWNTSDGGTGVTFPGDYIAFHANGSVPAAGNGSAGRVKLMIRSGLRIDVVVFLGGLVRQTPSYSSPPSPF